MFLRFLNQLERLACKAASAALAGCIPTAGSFLTVSLLALAFAGCSTNKLTRPEPKHYIDPPAQQKIPASTTALRVCADPNNLPFSNEQREGFENRIADLIASDMHLPVEYTWWAQRRGFFRNTLREAKCDVVIGVPASFELAMTTRPYYRSSYVFVTQRQRDLDIASLDDPRLRELTIGVQMIGDDGANTPPVHALNNRGLVENLKGFTVYGDYSEKSPAARVIDAVTKGDVDVAIVWGPLAGFFANKDLELKPVTPQLDPPYLPFVYDISVGVRRGEDDLRAKIDEILERRRAEIEKILDEFRVPRVSDGRTDFTRTRGRVEGSGRPRALPGHNAVRLASPPAQNIDFRLRRHVGLAAGLRRSVVVEASLAAMSDGKPREAIST
jgi:mxaJ protein